MNGLTQESHIFAGELVTAGVPTTTDPGQVLRIVTQAGVCALIEPAEVTPGMGLASLELTYLTRLLTSGPFDHHATERLDEALLLALPVVQPREPVGWDTHDIEDTTFPCRPMTHYRRISYPLTVHP
jgi:hypothetical protein